MTDYDKMMSREYFRNPTAGDAATGPRDAGTPPPPPPAPPGGDLPPPPPGGGFPTLPPTMSPGFNPTGGEQVFSVFNPRTINHLAFVSSLLLIPTLGFYRFWQTTRIRASIWSTTYLGDSPFEYTGTAVQLLVGFLVFIAITLPIYALSYLQLADNGFIGAAAGLLSSILFFFVFQMAVFRARRYRLSHTVWRGIRFSQAGNSGIYALRAMGWAVVTLLTLGLAYPWAAADLERYKTNRSYFGDRKFESEASARSVMKPYFLAYFIVAGPFVLSVLGSIAAGNVARLISDPEAAMRAADGAGGGAFVALILSSLWLVFGGMLMFPYYKAREFKAFVGVARCGNTRFGCDLTAWSLYRQYLIMLAMTTVSGGVAGILFAILMLIATAFGKVIGPEVSIIIAGIIGYLLFAVAYSGSYIRFLSVPLFAIKARSVIVYNAAALEDVVARRDQVSGFGDDFASSFDFGGI
ncbi:MAG: DUF898 family protein [Hyphomicrobiaceae bacterium]|nr:DUF898 family protein [Hyphomicrobiaceae bacterium]